MAIQDKQRIESAKRIAGARLSLMSSHPFYALLLVHFIFSLDESCKTFYTDGERVAFSPEFLEEIDDRELEFVLMHAALHAALSHPFRMKPDYDIDLYDKACDIVVNSNILHSFNKDIRRITLKKYGVAMHLTPDGKEGCEFTVDQVYSMLAASNPPSSKSNGNSSGDGKAEEDKEKGEKGNNQAEEGEEKGEKGNNQAEEGEEKGEKGNNQAEEGEEKGEKGNNQAEEGEEKGEKGNDQAEEGEEKGEESNSQAAEEMDKQGEPDATDADIKSGKYEINDLRALLKAKNKSAKEKLGIECYIKVKVNENMDSTVDDHSFWQAETEDEFLVDFWNNRVMQATNLVMEKEGAHKGYGGLPMCAQRLVKGLTKPEVDWRTMLDTFVQEEINDYSFAPPDRRMDDSPFFLPDFNEKEESIKNLWFLIDTSGSIGDLQIRAAYSEIISAMEMFNNKLQGYLSFTEVFVTDPVPFCSPEELLEIKPVGGGGNDFGEIFRYMQKNLMDDLPVSIIILTDGYDSYPPEEAALGIPVLWLINNEDSPEPPWGKFARFKVNDTKNGT